MNPKDRNEDKNNLCRLHHHVDVRVVPIEVVLKVQFCPRIASIDNKMIKPDDFDNTEEEKDVDENGEDGGHGEKVDTVALVHPTKFVLINHSAI